MHWVVLITTGASYSDGAKATLKRPCTTQQAGGPLALLYLQYKVVPDEQKHCLSPAERLCVSVCASELGKNKMEKQSILLGIILDFSLLSFEQKEYHFISQVGFCK